MVFQNYEEFFSFVKLREIVWFFKIMQNLYGFIKF